MSNVPREKCHNLENTKMNVVDFDQKKKEVGVTHTYTTVSLKVMSNENRWHN